MDILASTSFLPVQLAGNAITHSIDAVDPVAHPDRSNLKYQITLLVPEFPQSTTFVPLPTLDGREKPPTTAAGITTYEGAFFEFDAILDGFLALQKPLARQAVISSVATLTMPYKITETIQPLTQTLTRSTKWVMKAGLTQADAAGWASAFFDQYQNRNRQFLTWQPDQKTVGADSEEYLYFLLNLSPLPSQVRLRMELTYADGTVAVQTPLTLDSPVQYQVLCVPVGPQILAQYITATNPLRRYRVWLSNQDNERLTQIRRFLIDPRVRPSQRQILFSNSLGGFDTLRLVGSGSETLRVQRTMAQRDRPADAPVDFSKLFLMESTGSRGVTVSTGYFERNAPQMLRYLSELMLAKEWYLITEKGHLPLALSTTDLIDADDDSDLIARTFTFTVVDEQNAFSDLPAAPATLARPTGWRGVGFMHILDAVGKRTGMGRPVRLEKYFIDDNSLYKPLSQKPNVPGDPHYIAQLPLPGVEKGSTPYPSTAISRPTSYVRSNCPSGQVGGPVLISIPAGKYGGENAGDADALAEAEYTGYNTQAYADTNGTCTISPELYSYSVPAGQWHYRAGQPSKIAVYRANPNPDMGNTLNLPGGQYTYATNSNDLNFPADGAGSWRVFTYGTALKSYRLRVWRDGVLVQDRTFTMNRDGYELHLLLTTGAPATGQKFYLDLQAL